MSLKSILGIVLLIVLCLLGYYWWQQTHAETTLDGGSVESRDTPSSGKMKMDSGAVDLDGRDTSSPTYASSGATGSHAAAPAPAPVTPASSVPYTPVAGQAPSTMASLPNGVPASDTLSSDPPQGMAFGGSGKFQWYRQGNLTWRINTQSGSSCVAFATMDEWAKPIVASHGCGNA